MLRSYEFSESGDLTWKNKEREIFRMELEIAEKAVRESGFSAITTDRLKQCPVCGSTDCRPLYRKWEIPYHLCGSCGSIFCECSNSALEAYRNNARMKKLRLSEIYQQDALQRRRKNWEETVRWLQFRIYRYLSLKEGVRVIDIGNRYKGFVELLQNAGFCTEYELRESMLQKQDACTVKEADVLLYMNGLQQVMNPADRLTELRECLKPDGLLVLATRAGSGFDILALQENHEYIYPFEHITLPSVNGLSSLLARCGYRVLEVTTPGIMDVNYVYQNRDSIRDGSLFVKAMIRGKNSNTLREFQRFLQKNGLSSYVQIIAQKR